MKMVYEERANELGKKLGIPIVLGQKGDEARQAGESAAAEGLPEEKLEDLVESVLDLGRRLRAIVDKAETSPEERGRSGEPSNGQPDHLSLASTSVSPGEAVSREAMSHSSPEGRPDRTPLPSEAGTAKTSAASSLLKQTGIRNAALRYPLTNCLLDELD